MTPPPAPDPSDRLSQLMAHGGFLRVLVGRVLGMGAFQMLAVGTAWQMYELTGSAWDLGLVGLVQFLPVLLLTLLAGHAADRYHRARIVAASFALQCVVAAILLGCTLTGSVSRGLLFGVSALLGMARTFQLPAQQSLVASLVPAPLMARAMALNSSGGQVAVIGGPALAGLLYALGAEAVYAASAVLLLVATVALAQVHYQRQGSGNVLTLHSALAGVRFVWSRPPLLGAVSLDLMAVLFGGATALLPIYAKDILHVGPEGLGLLRSAPAVGALVMAVVMARHPLRRRVGPALYASAAGFGVCMIVFGLSTSFLLSMAALALSGAIDTVSVVIRQTLLQLDTPDDMRGRVGAVNSIFIGASNQLGEFESGAVAALLGPVASVVTGGIGTLVVVALWWKMFPGLARRDAF